MQGTALSRCRFNGGGARIQRNTTLDVFQSSTVRNTGSIKPDTVVADRNEEAPFLKPQ